MFFFFSPYSYVYKCLTLKCGDSKSDGKKLSSIRLNEPLNINSNHTWFKGKWF
uniref:Uncharacterized protein n=1 Tax=Tetranychus urticae TaxID=32264 RepID=T1KEP2_TETUR